MKRCYEVSVGGEVLRIWGNYYPDKERYHIAWYPSGFSREHMSKLFDEVLVDAIAENVVLEVDVVFPHRPDNPYGWMPVEFFRELGFVPDIEFHDTRRMIRPTWQ